jgi:phosphate-selective porin OprO/OprP
MVSALALAFMGAWVPAGAADETGQPAPAAKAEEKKAPESAPKAGGDGVKVSAGADGFVVQSENGDYRLKLTALVQGDARFFTSDTARLATDSFLLRSVRPIVQGTVARRFDFMLQPDFGQGQPSIQDAYLDARFAPALRFRVGKFKTPFGLERLQGEAYILFPERALPNDIVPNRDVGLQLHGELAGGVLIYQAALTNGVVDGSSVDLATGDSKDGALRAFLQPFKKVGGSLQGLGLGFAATFGRQQGQLLPVYRTPGQVAFFNYVKEASADGPRRRLSPQASFYGGPVGIIAEYVRSTQAVRKDKVSADVTNQAWQVAASWLVTGEKATSTGVKPHRAFDPGRGQWGAFELAARVHQLKIGADAFDLGFADIKKSARQATAWGVGLNWYFNRNIRYVVDFEHTRFDGGAATGDRENENVFFFRAQVAF